MATLGLPDSPGVPESVTRDTLIAKYNDLSSVEVQRLLPLMDIDHHNMAASNVLKP